MEVLNLFLELVQIDSPTGEEQALAQFIVAWVKEHCQIDARIDETGNVFLHQTGALAPIFLSAHMDTVEPGRGVQPRVEGEWIHSDGTTILGADNKNSLAALLIALAWHGQQPVGQRRKLEVLFTVEEEANNTGAVRFDATQLRAREGFMFDATLPVGTLISAAPFYARFDMTVQGSASHAGYRSQATPALGPALELLHALESLRSEKLLINVGTLSAGTARNTVIGTVQIGGEIRTFEREVLESALEDVRLAAQACSLPVSLDLQVENPGYIHDSSRLESVQRLFASILGRQPEIQPSFGCSDANILCEVLPVICCGSGELEPHTVRERVKISDLHDLVRLYQELMTKTFMR